MSGRKSSGTVSLVASSSKSGEPPMKRRRGANPEFGAPTQDDDASLLQPSSFPSAAASSTRVLPQRGTVPLLSSLAARCFVAHVGALSKNERSWAYSKRYLKCLPDTLVPRLFAMLRSSCPMLLSHGFIVLYFLRGQSLVLSSDLPGVQRQTITSVMNNAALRELHLIGFNKFADTVFASILPSLPHLRILVLRGCSKVGTKTAGVIGSVCRSLTTLNLNYTSVPPVSLIGPLVSCTNLEVVKVAGIHNWTDSTFAKLLAGLGQASVTAFPNMKTLKFRQLDLSESSIQAFVARCPNLTRLDISFTRIRRLSPPVVMAPLSLEKLSLTSTALSSVSIIWLVSAIPNLRTLHLGALGGGPGSSISVGNMTNDVLMSLTDIMEEFKHLEKLSLVGNTKLGQGSRQDGAALADFIRRVGRKCKHLNLSGLPHLQSQDLCGLVPEATDDCPPRLEELVLNNTGIDDDAAQYLAACSSLAVLEVVGTKLTSSGVFAVIDACPNLEKLDLTSCRGIRVADRRRFFEVWESERKKI